VGEGAAWRRLRASLVQSELASSSIAVIGLPLRSLVPAGAGASIHCSLPSCPATLAGLGLPAARCDSHPGDDGGDMTPSPACAIRLPAPLAGRDRGNGIHSVALAPLTGRVEHSPSAAASRVGLGAGLGGGDQCCPPAASKAEQTLARVSRAHSKEGSVGESVLRSMSSTGGGAAQVWLRGRGPERGMKVTGA